MKSISEARTCIVDNNVLNRFNLASSRFEVEGVEGSVEKHGGRFLNEAYLRRTYLQGQLHVLAGKEAVHCGSGCSALRLKWVKLAPKSSVLFGIRDKGGETHPIRVSVAP